MASTCPYLWHFVHLSVDLVSLNSHIWQLTLPTHSLWRSDFLCMSKSSNEIITDLWNLVFLASAFVIHLGVTANRNPGLYSLISFLNASMPSILLKGSIGIPCITVLNYWISFWMRSHSKIGRIISVLSIRSWAVYLSLITIITFCREIWWIPAIIGFVRLNFSFIFSFNASLIFINLLSGV
jgi:hypothetical protein